MKHVQQHFNEEAQQFDELIVKLIPDYPQMIAALVAAIPFDKLAPKQVIDLGCGTGNVADGVLNAFPNAHVTCLDLAENMIAMAQAKLALYQNVRYVVGDFNAFDGKYDVVLSSLALHHLATDDDKRNFYRRIYDSLTLGGIFYNADVVLGSSDFLQAMYMNQWRTFMVRSVPQEEIEGNGFSNTTPKIGRQGWSISWGGWQKLASPMWMCFGSITILRCSGVSSGDHRCACRTIFPNNCPPAVFALQVPAYWSL